MEENDRIEEPVEEPVVEPEPETEAREVELDPEFLEWVAQQDPKLVRKNVEQYTQTHQELSARERDLEEKYKPLKEIEQAFTNDPQFADYVMGYKKKDPSEETAEEKASRLEKEFHQYVEFNETKASLEQLHSQVKASDMPDFEDRELIEYATKHRIGSLKAAYLEMREDALKDYWRSQTHQEIKENAKAKVEVRAKGASTKTPSLDDQASMSDAEWKAAFGK